MKKILPLILVLIGLGGGVATGAALRPAPEPSSGEAHDPVPDTGEHDYVKMSNQFVIPVMSKGRVDSMVVLSLSLEAPVGGSEMVYAREPKLRDSFLQVMFDFANTGGFRGSFTDADNLVILRRSLLEAAKVVLGNTVSDVLIIDIMRQDN